MKTNCIPEDLHKELVAIKLEEGNKNAAELIKKLIIEYKRKKFLEASGIFRASMKKQGLTLKELLKRSRKIREEIVNGKFPNLCD